MANTRSFTGLEARRLLRRARTATLASLNREGGIPYASLANVATDVDGRPVILVSTLAWHTQNLLGDDRGGPMHVVHQLRMGMEIAPPPHDVGLQIGDAADDRHDG